MTLNPTKHTILQVLIPPKDLLGKLNKDSEDYQNVLDLVKYRVDWARYQEMQRRKEEEAAERERGIFLYTYSRSRKK